MAAPEDRFVDDIFEEEMLFGTAIRSPVARGEILSVSYPQLPEGYTLLFPDDVPGERAVSVHGESIPLFATANVSYRGEPLLLLCGPDEQELANLASSIEVRCREEPPLVFEEPHPAQLGARRELVVGDPLQAIAESARTVDGEYRTHSQEHHVSDPVGAFVFFEEERLVVYAPTQWPFHLRDTVASVLGVPKKHIIVRVTNMSAHKESRIWYPSFVAAHAALLAWKSKRSVKLVLTHEESLSLSPRRAPSRTLFRTGLDGEGNPTAHDIQLFIDCGAYPVLGEELLERAILGVTGVYRGAALRVRAQLVATSVPPMDALLGLGLAQGFFAAETHASRLAEITQSDPSTYRERNLIRPDDELPAGGIPAAYPPESLVRHTAEISDFTRKHAAYETLKKRSGPARELVSPHRGIGIATAYQGSGFDLAREEEEGATVTVRLEADGRLFIFTSGVSADGMARRAWVRSAARILGIEERRISVEEPDTEAVPDSGPSTLSRNITVIGELVERCCESIVRKRFRAALPIEVRKSLRPAKANRWNRERRSGMPFGSLSWGCAVVEAEVDPVTLDTTVRGIWMTVACGRLLDERAARSTIENGIFHALWWCSTSHGSVRYPVIEEIPPLVVEFMEPASRGEAGGIGELAGSVVPSAYVSAVAQATGRYFDTLPLTPELIYRYSEAQ